MNGMRRAVGVAAWAGLAWITLLWRLGSFGLVGPDEPRYAAIAAGMLRHKDWITPRLWGSAWFEKPVLFYWLAGLSQALTQVGAAAARRPNAILAVILCAAMALFLRREHSARAGWLAGFMGLSSAFVIGFGRAATTDMTLTVPLTLALLAGYAWWQRRRPATLAWAAVALAVAALAKGPVAVALAGLILIPFAATQRRLRELLLLLKPLPLALFFLVAAPWYVALELRQPEFFRVFFLQHNLERFATNKFEHPQAWWFYLPVLLLAVFPWTGWLSLPLRSVAGRLRRRGWGGFWDGRDAGLKFYLGIWVLAPVLFFTLSRSKLPGYILPAIPAAIMLMAVRAAEAWPRLSRIAVGISAVLAGLIPAAVRLAPWALLPRAQRPLLGPLLRDPGVELLAGLTIFFLLLLALRRRTLAATAATCALVAVAVLALTQPPLSTAIDLAYSGRPLARSLAAQCQAGLPLRCGNVPIYMWHLNRSLQYGMQFGLEAALPEWPEWPETGLLPAQAIVITERSAAASFAAQYGMTMQVARMSRFLPSPEARPPWVVLRVGVQR